MRIQCLYQRNNGSIWCNLNSRLTYYVWDLVITPPHIHW